MGILSKCPLSPYKGKWQHNFSEKQAMEALKKTVTEEQNPSLDFLSILTNSFRSHGLNPSQSAYTFIIRYLFHKRLFSELPPILDNLEKADKLENSEAIFVDLIRGYGKAGMLQDALNVFYRMPKFRCAPSARSLDSLLCVLCKNEEGLVLVPDVLMRTPEMNIRLRSSSFQILIRALCRKGRVGHAMELFNIIKTSDEFALDSRMYSLILCSLCKHATSNEVMSFLKEMWDAGLMPNVWECTTVINLLVRQGKASDAYAVLNKMKIGGIRPDVMTYTTVLEAFVLADDFSNADELFDEILLMGLVPHVSTYNTYINSLCKKGDLEGACRMVVCMDRAGCKPDVGTFNTLIAGYSEAGEFGRGREVMNEMLQKGLRWNMQTYMILVDGLIHEGKMVEACKIFVDMLTKGFTPLPSTFHDLAYGLCMKGLYNEAVPVLEEMISRSIAPDASLWEALLVGFKMSSQQISMDLKDITEPLPC